MKVQAESFHLNGHITGFSPHTQKLESPNQTPSNTLAVKGLKYVLFSAGGISTPNSSYSIRSMFKERYWCLLFIMYVWFMYCVLNQPEK